MIAQKPVVQKPVVQKPVAQKPVKKTERKCRAFKRYSQQKIGILASQRQIDAIKSWLSEKAIETVEPDDMCCWPLRWRFEKGYRGWECDVQVAPNPKQSFFNRFYTPRGPMICLEAKTAKGEIVLDQLQSVLREGF